MNKLVSLLQRAPKRAKAAMAVLAAVVVLPATLLAWGPDRQTFTYEKPADYVTFNSITNNPKVGDERNFVRIKEDNSTSTFEDNVTLQPGKVYQVMVYYHNNAASNLNASGKGIAKDTTLKMEIPGVVKAGVNAAFTGTISASNSKPGSVWDEAYGKNATNGDIALRYVENSAVVTSNGAVNGKTLPDSLFTTGAKLGYDSLDGILPGCNQYAGYVTFKFRVDQPNFTIKKEVSVDGKTWKESVDTTPGSTVNYRIIYQNTGTSTQDNVILRDMLPAGVTYVDGSSLVYDASTNGKYVKAVDGITSTGYNAGSYLPNGNVYFKFQAKVTSEDKLACGKNTLKNIARATTSAGYKEDDADVTIEKKCEEPKKIQVCDLISKKVITIDEKDFDSKKHSKNLDDCKPSEDKDINVCRLSDKKYPVTIKESQFDKTKYSKDPNDCKTTPETPETPESPEVPELPTTGPGEVVASILGAGSLTAATSAYVASRRRQ